MGGTGNICRWETFCLTPLFFWGNVSVWSCMTEPPAAPGCDSPVQMHVSSWQSLLYFNRCLLPLITWPWGQINTEIQMQTSERPARLMERADLNYGRINSHLTAVRAANILSCSSRTFNLSERAYKQDHVTWGVCVERASRCVCQIHKPDRQPGLFSPAVCVLRGVCLCVRLKCKTT